MAEKLKNFLLVLSSGIIAFCLQGLLLLALFWAFYYKPTKYATLKTSAISIESIDIEAYLELDSNTHQALNTPKSNPLEGSGLKDMFALIDSTKSSKSQEISDDRLEHAQNTRDLQALNELAQQSRDLKERLQNINTLTIANNSADSQDGAFDEWYASVSEILQKEWDNSVYVLPSGLVGVVAITIDMQGKMNFMVKRYTQNTHFDSALDSTLKRLETLPFPPAQRSARTILVEFKSNKNN
ncbi:TonB C-terminal domain-containing protein [Helicobacter himalayensis]|uniref:TonB C-terminal domain-containing protein n=1 Tax=Helicobacter himalayensis TaxID=1591088 RepID=UPI00082B25B8|nr:TonB C-terminal domain-containing protein [Helicobacter himalayensis]